MKGGLIALALGAVTFTGVLALADATQNRPDGSRAGTRSEVVFEVATKGHYDRNVAALGLWSTCQQTVDRVVTKSFEPRRAQRFAAVVVPALGEQARRRFIGCLEDFTIDRVLGDVVRVRALEPTRSS
jgi:hypothetical protein